MDTSSTVESYQRGIWGSKRGDTHLGFVLDVQVVCGGAYTEEDEHGVA